LRSSEPQDGIAAVIDGHRKAALADAAKLVPLLKGTPTDASLATFDSTAAAWRKALSRALTLSRRETVANADDRSGSRDLYTRELAPAMVSLAGSITALQDAVARETSVMARKVADHAVAKTRLLIVICSSRWPSPARWPSSSSTAWCAPCAA
jgi:hypothetical protein